MDKAHDRIQLITVSARSASKERYRYMCLCCGEDVYLAKGPIRRPYFKHWKENNNKECEEYVKRHNALSLRARSMKINTNKVTGFYFNIDEKMFEIGIKFNNDEIEACEERPTDFEVRVAPRVHPFLSLQINRKNFFPDTPKMIPLDCFSYNYFLSITSNRIEQEYTLFRNIPTFFKMQEDGSRAKLVQGEYLYTNVHYLVVCQNESQRYDLLDKRVQNKQNKIRIENPIGFTTMGKDFWCEVITIFSRTPKIEEQLRRWGYALKDSETLTLLWPPCVFFDSIASTTEDAVYLYSTFDLQPNRSTNLGSQDIEKITERLSRVSVQYQVKIHGENTKLTVEKRQMSDDYVTIPIQRSSSKTYRALDNYSFLFNNSGVSPLSEEMSVPMTPMSEIKHYKFGYLDEIVVPQQCAALSGESLLQDALMHYKRTETFYWDDYGALDLSQVAFRYMEDCEKSGVINSAVKCLIKEGRI